MATNFEPHECVIFYHSVKIGTHENKGIHSILNSCNLFIFHSDNFSFLNHVNANESK